MSNLIFWFAALTCALSQAAIVRSALRARAQRPDGAASPSRPIEVAWTVLPAVMLLFVLLFTWRALHQVAPFPLIP